MKMQPTLFEKLRNKNIILASGSPRRHQLLKEFGVKFTVKKAKVKEVYPPHLKKAAIAEYLAALKAAAFEKDANPETILITADTIVCLNNEVLGKPRDAKDAFNMLRLLSGKKHEVITAICLLSGKKKKLFSSTTAVYFKRLKDEEIDYYISHYKPFDKAGAYGIQEWIGYIGIEKIEGCYFNVVGLPMNLLYDELGKFL